MTSKSGIPVYEESYAIRRNRTNTIADKIIDETLLNPPPPTINYNWNRS